MALVGISLLGQTHAYGAAELGRIAAPTLVAWGKRDIVVPARHAATALHAIPDCRAVVLSRAGHASQIDKPEAIDELILEFLATGRLAREDPSGRRLIRL